MDIMVDYQELINMINNSEISYKCRECLEKIYSNDELIDMIKKYNDTYDIKLRDKIYENEDFINYKKIENEVNVLILQINSIFKELKDESN